MLDGARVPDLLDCGRCDCRRVSWEVPLNKRKTGSRYETLAARYLEKKGYLIVHQNYRCRAGEIIPYKLRENIITHNKTSIL